MNTESVASDDYLHLAPSNLYQKRRETASLFTKYVNLLPITIIFLETIVIVIVSDTVTLYSHYCESRLWDA